MRISKPQSFLHPWQRISLILAGSLLFWLAGPQPALPALAGKNPPPQYFVHLPLVQSGQPNPAAQNTPSWLAQVNRYRSQAGLPAVVENPALSQGNLLHARYAVKNDVLAHSEDPQNPWYTSEGSQASASSNLMANWDTNISDEAAVDSWMQAPFHAVSILDPTLKEVGFGSYREKDGEIQMSAGLDILQGRGSLPVNLTYPVTWPGNGSSVSLRTYWGEYPDPLSSCPGYSAPSGLPVLVLMGNGDGSPRVTSYSLAADGQPLETCVFTENTYVNADAQLQSLGRSILNARDGIVLIPKQPLPAGAQINVDLTVDGQEISWSFFVK